MLFILPTVRHKTTLHMNEYTHDDVEKLININKKIENTDLIIDLNNSQNKIYLHSVFNNKHKFILDIKSTTKINGKASLHSLEIKHNKGLIRLDFRGRHTNPDSINDKVPESLIKYKSKVFNIDEPHLHIYVEGYNLSWALPIEDTIFKDLKLNERSDLGIVLTKFARRLNIIDNLNIQNSLL